MYCPKRIFVTGRIKRRDFLTFFSLPYRTSSDGIKGTIEFLDVAARRMLGESPYSEHLLINFSPNREAMTQLVSCVQHYDAAPTPPELSLKCSRDQYVKIAVGCVGGEIHHSSTMAFFFFHPALPPAPREII